MKIERLVTALGAIAVATACASGGSGGEEGGVEARVEVINEVQPPSTVSVYMDEEVGGRTLLGTVAPMATRTLPVRSFRSNANYRLEARTDGGREIVSGRFTLNPGETVTWNLRTNVLGP
ncbi:MAG: hypothetical protein KY397_05595 [Gemmatimonadetes bacterium]|nr:hypothetical protein [Gemmatimonadota bacterium]